MDNVLRMYLIGFCKNKKQDYAVKKLRIILAKFDEVLFQECVEYVKSLYNGNKYI